MTSRLSRLVRSLRRDTAAQRAAKPVALESLEQRQLMAVSPVVAGTKIKSVNLSAGGVSLNSSLVTVPFSGDITLVDASKIRVFGYATNPLSSKLGQIKKTINISNVNVLALDVNNDGTVDHQLLQFTTDRLIRKGATIVFNDGAINDTSGNPLAAQTRHAIKGQNKERFTLACRLFAPTLHSRFTSDIYADAAPASASTAPADATVTANLQAFLQQKVTAGIITQAQADAAVTRYNAAATIGIFPDANLRAALFSLTGTFAESAISSYLDGNNLTGKPYTIVTFQTPADTSVPVAQTSVRSSDGRLRTIFKPQFAGEDFRALSAHLAHEALHQDSNIGLEEEETANIFEVLIYAQQAQAQILAGTAPGSTFINQNTALINLENDKLAAFIQSGKTIFPYVGVLNAPHTINLAQGIFPGQVTPGDGHGVYTSFDDFTQRTYKARGAVSQATAGLPLLNTYYHNITGKTASANMQFSQSLINDIDSFQGILTTHLSIQMASALRMGLA